MVCVARAELPRLGSAPRSASAGRQAMRFIRYRRPGAAAMVIALGLLLGPRPDAGDGGHRRTSRTCTSAAATSARWTAGRASPASTAMMLNFIARARPAPRPDADPALRPAARCPERRDPAGLRPARLGTRADRTTPGDRAQRSAIAGRRTRRRWRRSSAPLASSPRPSKPVGLTVMNGRHAVVMTGFEASRDPRYGDFTLSAVLDQRPDRLEPQALRAGRQPDRPVPGARCDGHLRRRLVPAVRHRRAG